MQLNRWKLARKRTHKDTLALQNKEDGDYRMVCSNEFLRCQDQVAGSLPG